MSIMSTQLPKNSIVARYFYLGMALLIVVISVYGFGQTIDTNLIHPSSARPFILYAHAAVFSVWLIFFVLQTAWVRAGHVRWHRNMGWFGVVLGITIPLLGVSTAIAMSHFHLTHLSRQQVENDLIIPLCDMTAFTAIFSLAVLWRKKLDFHRRLMLMATCVLTSPAFGRFPPNIMPTYAFYAGVDVLILLGVIHDLHMNRRVHKAYAYGLPVLMIGQMLVMRINLHGVAGWSFLAGFILGF